MNTRLTAGLISLALGALGLVALGIAAASAPKTDSYAAISTVILSDDGGRGSGVHIGSGWIVTAAHVVEDKSSMLATDSLGGTHVAKVLWVNKEHDTAFLQISDYDFIAASQIDCAPRYRADVRVEAIGSPLNLRFIHTWGRVASEKIVSVQGAAKEYIPLNIAVAPGMSGGPVLDSRKRVVGIVSAIMNVQISMTSSSFVSIGYMIPSSTVCRLMGRTE